MSYPPPSSPQNGDNPQTPAPAATGQFMPTLPYAPPPQSPQPGVGSGGAASFDNPTAAPPLPALEYAYKSPLAGVTTAALANENPHPSRNLAGLALGLLVGLVCAFLYDKFVFYTGIGVGIIASAIGFAVGYAVTIGCGRGGTVPALIGAGVSLFSMLASRFMLLNDMASKQFGHTVVLPVNAETIGLMFHTMTPFTWIIVAIGVYGGYVTPHRTAANSATPR